MKKICQKCSVEFEVPQHRAEIAKFCSMVCRDYKSKVFMCLQCGKEGRCAPSKSPKFCSKQCCVDSQKGTDTYSERTNKSRIKHRYGLSDEVYQFIKQAQSNCCAICGIHRSKRKKELSIDHDHVSGIVRGLLCEPCNLGLGNFRDNIKFLKQAVQYLEAFEETAKILQEEQVHAA